MGFTVEELAREAGVSHRYLKRQISDKHVLEFAKYMIDYRLIGPWLELEDQDLSDIDDERKAELRRMEVLKRWKRKKIIGATYWKLIEALIKCDRNSYAYEICCTLAAEEATGASGTVHTSSKDSTISQPDASLSPDQPPYHHHPQHLASAAIPRSTAIGTMNANQVAEWLERKGVCANDVDIFRGTGIDKRLFLGLDSGSHELNHISQETKNYLQLLQGDMRNRDDTRVMPFRGNHSENAATLGKLSSLPHVGNGHSADPDHCPATVGNQKPVSSPPPPPVRAEGRIQADSSQDIPKPSDPTIEFKSDLCSQLLNIASKTYAVVAEELLNIAPIHLMLTGRGIKLAIIDGGFNFSHVSLPPRSDVRLLSDDSSGISPNGPDHGTNTAGIAAGKEFVSEDKQTYPGGIAPDVKLTLCTFNGTLEGLRKILLKLEEDENFNDVVSLSWGVDRTKVSKDLKVEFHSIVKRLEKKGTTIFAASGNSGNSQKVTFPACLRNVVSVGSHDKYGKTADYSREEGNDVDICVYGEALAPTGLANQLSYVKGTSMATPVAAAVTCLALECAKQPTINGEECIEGKEGKVALLKAMKDSKGVLKPGIFFLDPHHHNKFWPDDVLHSKFNDLIMST